MFLDAQRTADRLIGERDIDFMPAVLTGFVSTDQ